jgi:hypothetical protein
MFSDSADGLPALACDMPPSIAATRRHTGRATTPHRHPANASGSAIGPRVERCRRGPRSCHAPRSPESRSFDIVAGSHDEGTGIDLLPGGSGSKRREAPGRGLSGCAPPGRRTRTRGEQAMSGASSRSPTDGLTGGAPSWQTSRWASSTSAHGSASLVRHRRRVDASHGVDVRMDDTRCDEALPARRLSPTAASPGS